MQRRDRLRRRAWRWTSPFAQRRRRVRRAYAAALLPSRPAARFCVITSGRAGSELLVQLADSHPEVTCESEILRDAPQWPRLFVRGRANLAALHGARAYGFKMPAHHLTWPSLIRDPDLWFADLAAAGFRLVRIRRRDMLRQAISHERATLRRVWHEERVSSASAHAPEIDPARVVRTLTWIEEREATFDRVLDGLNVMLLTYEDDLAGAASQRATAVRLFAMLGLGHHEPRADLVAASPRSLEHLVGNWPDVRAAVAATRFRKLLPS